MATIGDLIVKVSAHTAPFAGGLKKAAGPLGQFSGMVGKAAKMLTGFGLAVAGVAGIGNLGGLVIMVKRELTAIDRTTKLSTQLGIATEDLLKFQHAAELTGATKEMLAKSIQYLNRSLGQAAAGYGQASRGLDLLGLKAEDLIAKGPAEAMRDIAEAVSRIDDPTRKAAAATALFGRSGIEMLNFLQSGRAGLEKMGAEAERLGGVFDNEMGQGAAAAVDAIANLKKSIGGLATQGTLQLAPFIKVFADDLTNGVVNAKNSMGDATHATSQWAAEFGALGAGVLHTADAIQEMKRNWIAFKIVMLEGFRWTNQAIMGTEEYAATLKRLYDELADSELAPDASKVLAEKVRASREALAAELRGTPGTDGDSLMGDLVIPPNAMDEAAKMLTELRKKLDADNPFDDMIASLQSLKPVSWDEYLGIRNMIADLTEARDELTRLDQEAKDMAAGQAMRDALRTPIEEYEARMADTRRLLEVGAIDYATAMREAAAAEKDLLASGGSQSAAGPQFAATLRAGSAEAYRSMIAAQTGRQDPGRELLAEQRRHGEHIRRQTAALEELRDRQQITRVARLPK